MKSISLIFALLLLGSFSSAQQISILNLDHPEVSFRGLHAVDNSVLWVSGTQGTIGKSLNGGKSFIWLTPEGYEEMDFRSIFALDHMNVVIASAGAPAVILKSSDGGKSWTETFRDENPDAFLDAMDFTPYNAQIGMVVGDPVDGKPYMLRTTDGGETWKRMRNDRLPAMKPGEAYFAASNSNIRMLDDIIFLGVTGGSDSRLIVNNPQQSSISLDKTDSPTSGANGLDYFLLTNFGLIAGGDFENPESSENNMFLFELDENMSPVVRTPVQNPDGYKSGVAILNGSEAISCGLTGVDYTEDGGLNWRKISSTPFHSCEKSKSGKKVYLAGPNGSIGVLSN